MNRVLRRHCAFAPQPPRPLYHPTRDAIAVAASPVRRNQTLCKIGRSMSVNDRSTARTSAAGQLATFLVAAAVLVPAVTAGQAVSGDAWLKFAFLARIALLVALATWLLRRDSLGWSDVGLRRPQWRRFLIALPAGVVMTLCFAGIAKAVLAWAGLDAPNYAMFAPIRSDLAEYLFWLLPVSIGSAAFGEEMIFRGFMTNALCRMFKASGVWQTVAAISLQAMIFGGLHAYQGLGGAITAGAVGLALGLTWLISGRNLWAGILIHALLDGGAMTAIYLGAVAT